jgi:Cu-Zn family superoxide dismutase
MLARMLGILGIILCMSVGMGCRETRVDPSGVDQVARPERREARARLQSAAGQDVQGEVLFQETEQGVRLKVVARGLTPGMHGFHVHEVGDCSAPDFESAGEHFAPAGHPHGAPAASSHAGDLGNVEADASGAVETVMMTRHVELDEGPRSIAGRAIVIHAQPDDLSSQPSGNAGARVACGVIELEDGGS